MAIRLYQDIGCVAMGIDMACQKISRMLEGALLNA